MTRIVEFYDIMNIENKAAPEMHVDSLPTNIKDGFETNPFLGFSNSNMTQSTVTVAGKHMADGINTNISIDAEGNILCYPPNAYVPYWSRIVFKKFDYNIQPAATSAYKDIIGNEYDGQVGLLGLRGTFEFELYEPDSTLKYTTESSAAFSFSDNAKLKLKSYDSVPVFLKFDEYTSRSKVVKTKQHEDFDDVSFTFGYPKGSTEPIKLNLSLSANPPVYNGTPTPKKYNNNLTLDEISKLFKSCYWSIEWQADKILF